MRGLLLVLLPLLLLLLLLRCRHNGEYVQTRGLMEQVLMDKLLAFVKQREADGK
jgi:hypothetical protein